MHRLVGLLAISCVLSGCGERAPDTNQAAAAPAEINLDNALVFANAAQCEAAPALRRALDRMLVHDEGTDSWRVGGAATLSGIGGPLVPRLRVERSEVDGLRVIDYQSTLDLPAGARWRGLRVSRLVVTHLDVFESDDQDETAIHFAEPPATVQRVLSRHGMSVPLAPAYRELDDGACGGAMQIAAIPGGAALTCGYGC